ncbi:hypothetical protein AMS68_001907 [Peltaster fructicola]|uniref:Transcription elongation factor n=1 Tax=Peltaster fructicola TaxID=286661 RepID=A0A6H0XPI2_9PEZI|nr:hypothetical protein AMS68_001907 [Peltaster fructicola]
MDAKQLTETGKQIAKAIEGGDSSAAILHLLQPLQKWSATEDALRQSKIGVAVNKLRQNKDPKISEIASRLINKWKSDVNANKKKAPGSPAIGAIKANGTNGTNSGTSSPAPVKKESRKSTVDPEKRNSKTDGVNTEVTGNQTRDGCVTLMYNGLAYLSEESPDDVLEVARGVELAAFNEYQPETSTEYKAKIRSLFQNLKIKGNVRLRRDVFSGAIAPKTFVTMTSDELKSAEKRAEDAALNKENMRVAMVAQVQRAISTTMQCGKCKAKKVAYTQAQTRSADEPMTTFCECMNCDNKWKFS